MMADNRLTTITDADEIEMALKRFIYLIKQHSTQVVETSAGIQGGGKKGTLEWSNDLKIWMFNRYIKKSRYWNAFGVKKPLEGISSTITTEINFPIEGINRRIAGAFVRDKSEVYVVHRGKLGGNFSKKFFEENYSGKWTKIQDGNKDSEVVLIGSLSDPLLPYKVSKFVYEVERMKSGKSSAISIYSFFSYLENKGHNLSRGFIEDLLLSLKLNPFIFLTGNPAGKNNVIELFSQYLNELQGDKSDSITTLVKPNLSSIKYGAWTLDRKDLDPLNIDFVMNFDIEIDNMPTRARLSMSPRLWYEDHDGKIKSMLEKLSETDPKKDIKLKILIDSKNNSRYVIIPTQGLFETDISPIDNDKINTNPHYQKVSNLILNASRDRDNPYFLILDDIDSDLNFERFIGDLMLSITGENHFLFPNNDLSAQELKIPDNLFVVGTVKENENNLHDDPRFPARGNIMEIMNSEEKSSYDGQFKGIPLKDQEYLENPLSDIKTRSLTLKQLKKIINHVKVNSSDYLWDIISEEIKIFLEVMLKAGFDSGSDVDIEILRFMYVGWVYEGQTKVWNDWTRYFDSQIKQKILPKFQGAHKVPEETLVELFQLCYHKRIEKIPDRMEDITRDPDVKYLNSALKIQEMDIMLKN